MSGRPRTTRRRIAIVLCAVAAGAAAACARTVAPPSVSDTAQSVPDLRGQRVMLFPVQSLQGVDAAVDAELAYAIGRRNANVDLVLPEQMRRASATSPGLDVKLEGLPVGVFMQTEVRRIGDPLFGHLRRMGALVSSDFALIPVMARYRPEVVAGSGTTPAPSGIEIAATLINVRDGQVHWFGLVEGSPGAADDPRALASAAEALVRRILPFAGRTPR